MQYGMISRSIIKSLKNSLDCHKKNGKKKNTTVSKENPFIYYKGRQLTSPAIFARELREIRRNLS